MANKPKKQHTPFMLLPFLIGIGIGLGVLAFIVLIIVALS